MAKNKTSVTEASAYDFIDRVADPVKRDDCQKIAELMKKETGFEPKMWGPSIVGFGNYHYKYDSGHEGDAPLIGFSPRSNAITLYMSCSLKEKDKLLERLGKHKAGKGCVYIKKLADIDLATLTEMIDKSVGYIRNKYEHST